MSEKKLQKKIVDKIGRIFAMLFNRAVMYNMSHPFTTQSMNDFFKMMQQELKAYSPIVIIMHKDSFFVEDEPLDPRTNTSKMLMHFKKGGVQSISFEDGLTQEELEKFFHIFTDMVQYPSAEVMKDACEKDGITKARINHVFFKKVTADEEVLSRDEIKKVADTKKEERFKSLKDELLDMISGGLALEDLGKSLPISQVLAHPEQVSSYLNLPSDQTGGALGASSGDTMLNHVSKIKLEVDKAAIEANGANLHELASSVMRLRDELIRGIIERKEKGLVFQNEEQIMDETKSMTDNVLLGLVKQEYQQGATPVKRLAQIVKRLIPDNDELQRVLPKLKEVLLLEGMPLNDFLEFTGELEREISNAAISSALKKSADEIGVSGEDLLKEITSNPKEAAELIYLAAELKKETGDKDALTDVLVEYIERISGNVALDSDGGVEDSSTGHLKSILSQVQSEILDRLKSKNMDSSVMETVAQNLNARMDKFLEKLEINFSKRQSSMGTWDSETTSLMKLFEDQIGDPEQFKAILSKVREAFDGKRSGTLHIESIRFELDDEKGKDEGASVESSKPQAWPKGILNRKNILFFIEKEMNRSVRYKTPFSLITLSILRAIPQKKFAVGTITRDAITYHVLENLTQSMRDTDMVGMLDSKKVIILLPMTNKDDAKLALRRLLKSIHSKLIKINDIPLEVRFAGSVSPFEKNSSPQLKELIRKAEHDIYDMVQRIKNLQSMY